MIIYFPENYIKRGKIKEKGRAQTRPFYNQV